jgi:divalent metal cation (Fe/Co/Zn/Cd) transporter
VAVVFQTAARAVSRDAAGESLVGTVLLVASLTIMPLLAIAKLGVAAREDLRALAAEARETAACFYVSATALTGLLAVALVGWWWVNRFFALLIVLWLVKEGIKGLRGEACFDGAVLFWCRKCWFELAACADMRVPRAAA